MSKRSIPGGIKDANGVYQKITPPVFEPFKLSNYCFDKQLKFIEDPRPFKVAVCSRRAGKTVACAAHLISTALETANVICLYITLSRNNAKKLIWREIQKINRDYNLGGVEDQTELSMTWPNGSAVYCSGAKDASEIEKFRGLALKLCYIDECQSFRSYLQELIDDIISPALMDYAGTLCLIGTPGPIPSGYFYECAEKSEAWSRHAWTFFDNPFIPAKSKMPHQALLDRELKRRGVKSEDPSIQREWFGRWVLDSDSLWIHYSAELNHFDDLPVITPHKYTYAMGIDLGFEDADAIAIVAWSDANAKTYLVEESVVRKQGLTELVAEVQRLQKKYDIVKMVIDEGGLGKKLAEEMRRRHQLPVVAADKVRKQENVAFLNDALRTSRFMARRDSFFAQDSMLVEIDRSKSTPDRIKLSDKYHSDIIDSVLYIFKESPSYAYQAETKKPKYGSEEWALAQQDDMWEAAVQHYEAEAELKKRISGLGYPDEN